MEKFAFGSSLSQPKYHTVKTTIKSDDNTMTYVEALFHSGYMATDSPYISSKMAGLHSIYSGKHVVWLGKLFQGEERRLAISMYNVGIGINHGVGELSPLIFYKLD